MFVSLYHVDTKLELALVVINNARTAKAVKMVMNPQGLSVAGAGSKQPLYPDRLQSVARV